MGFLSSVTGGLSDVLFGESPSTTTVQAKDKIMPADATETALYDSLGTLNQDNLEYASYLGGDRQGIYDQTMANMYDWQNQLGNMQYDGQLNPMMQTQLQTMLQNQLGNIENYANEGVGGIANQMANRGVLNSSATGKTMGDLGRNVQNLQNDAQNNYMQQYMNAFQNQNQFDFQRMMAEGQSLGDPYSFINSAYSNAYADPFNLWNNIRDDRYGLESDTLMTPATTGLVQNAGSSLGLIPFLG